ncbi:MAG TPA: winged helix DNA-binding domain-containing protein [Thermoanaerobaculia bacterium]|jgi:hypothetical protein|nr:winged helix DNA-binding domain-containing protein [Thermoanaerobaculia bacterium]
MSIPLRRLHTQLLADNPASTPHITVTHFGAIQAQDYLGALWAVGVRTNAATEEAVEHAITERKIIRCWPMRGTLHFVAAEDVHWMLELLAPRVLKRHRPRLEREFDLDPRTLRRARTLVERALLGGNSLTRPEIYAILEKARIATGASRGLHILSVLAHERVICFGARRGKQPTVVLLDEWLPASKPRSREESLAELARRYFTSHGPATIADFTWWSGLTVKEANEGLALAGSLPEFEPAAKGTAHLLPPFDEYTVAYKDRDALIDRELAKRVNAGGGMINAIAVVNGLVVGTWKRTLHDKSVEIRLAPFRTLTARETRALEREATRYAKFLGKENAVLKP